VNCNGATGCTLVRLIGRRRIDMEATDQSAEMTPCQSVLGRKEKWAELES